MLDRVKALFKPKDGQQAGLQRGQYYERMGECHQCGKCCTNIYLVHGDQTIDSMPLFEELKAQNPEYQYFRPVSQGDGDGLVFQCQHLQANNTCGIYEERPDFCRRYPSEHTLLMGGKLAEGCGYQFRLLKNFQDVLKTMHTPSSGREHPGRTVQKSALP